MSHLDLRLASRFFLATLALLLPLGCSYESDPSGTTVTDSAGIRIVESSRFAWQAGEGWRISEEPALQIGQREGPEALQFFRITDAMRLPDGRLAVLNSGSESVRVFSARGEFLAEFGGPGDGPGEFRSLTSVHHFRGDTLLLWDVGRPGYSLFTPEGALARTQLLRPPGSERASLLFLLEENRLLLTTFASILTEEGDPGLGIHRRSAPFFLLSEDGGLLDTLGVLPGAETMVMEFGGNTGVGPAPFLKDAYTAVLDDRIYIGTADHLEVSVMTSSGEVEAVYRYPNLDLTVTESDEAWYKDRMAEMAATPQEQQMLPVILEALVFPETRAAYSEMKIAEDGTLWLRTGRHMPAGAPSREWTVISKEGAFLGPVLMPDRFNPLHFGSDYVLGVWEDELDVEFLRLYELLK